MARYATIVASQFSGLFSVDGPHDGVIMAAVCRLLCASALGVLKVLECLFKFLKVLYHFLRLSRYCNKCLVCIWQPLHNHGYQESITNSLICVS